MNGARERVTREPIAQEVQAPMSSNHTPPDRFWANIEFTDTCWLWRGALNNFGYGRLGSKYVHRMMYEFVYGSIPEPTLDHLCRTRHCLAPEHLEPVSLRVNLMRGYSPSAIHARKTHCVHGHEFNEPNTIARNGGRHRRCRECTNAQARERRLRRVVTPGHCP